MQCPVCRADTAPAMSRCPQCNATLAADPVEETSRDRPALPWQPDSLTSEPWPPEPRQPEPWQPEPRQPEPWQPEPWQPQPARAPRHGRPDPWQHEPTRYEQQTGPGENALGYEPTLVNPDQAGRPWQPEPAVWTPGSGADPWPQSPPGAGASPPDQPWRVDPAALSDAPRVPQTAPAWLPPPGPRHRQRRTAPILFVAAAIVVAGAIATATILLWPGSGPKTRTGAISRQSGTVVTPAATSTASATSAAADAATEAAAVGKVLDDMTASRSEVSTAIINAGQCSALDGAVTTMQTVVGERQSELTAAQALQVDALTSGAALKDALTKAVQASLDADQAYLSWAKAGQGCSGTTPPNSDLANGNTISDSRATPAKKDFLALWAPIAQQLQQPPRDVNHI